MNLSLICFAFLFIMLISADAYLALGLYADLTNQPEQDTLCQRCKTLNETVYECAIYCWV